MLPTDALPLLKRLLKTAGPSGFELAPARVWRRAAAQSGTVSADAAGNSYVVVEPDGWTPDDPSIVIVGHIDEIGLMVNEILPTGFLRFRPIGGWDVNVFVGQRVQWSGPKGPVMGVIGRSPTHFHDEEDEKTTPKVHELWVDIGTTSAKESERLVEVGTPGVLMGDPIDMPNNRLASRAMDNRVGAFIALDVARRYAERPGSARVVAVASTREEIGGSTGARVAVTKYAPVLAIAVDLTHANDTPDATDNENPSYALGGGPVIATGGTLSPVAFQLLRNAAKRRKIAVRFEASPGGSGTDADEFGAAGHPVASACVSVPCRHMHSPSEIVALNDIEETIQMLTEMARHVTKHTNFVR